MFKNILQKYSIWIITYIVALTCFYIFGTKILSIYFNYLLYFLAFILTIENSRKSNLNKDIILVFKYFYFYSACLLVLIQGAYTLNDATIILDSYLYLDMGQSTMILMLSIYLFIISINVKSKNTSKLMVICGAIALVMTFMNYYKFILVPESFYVESMSEIYFIKKYLFNLISIVLLLVFWIRYYNKFFILSEYLSIIIFLFMLSTILDALHYIASQYYFQFFAYGLYIFLALNALIVVLWYIRLEYLNTGIAKENEKYLTNYKFLEGIVNKPRQSIFQKFFISVSPNYLVLFLALLVLGIISLYLAKFINLYLMLNTIFIAIITILAIYYSFSSIKRNWTNQFGFMLKNNKEKV